MLGIFLLGILQVTVVFAQSKKITGTVTASGDGTGIPGVSVIIQGTTSGTQTDADGRYVINVAVGQVLLFRSIGFAEKSVTVGASDVVHVSLEPQADELSEVVVIAYGRAKKESLTGAVSSITAKDIEKRPVTNAVGVLEGSAAGIQVNNTTGTPGGEPSVRIRGFASVNGSNTPLYVIDGVPFAGNFSDINPNDVESITVLKDAASAALYGAKATNGVIIITTKMSSKSAEPGINVTVNQGLYTRGIKEYKRMNDREFMETMWKGYRNYLMSSDPTDYPTAAAAGAEATNTLISDYLYLNIYDKPDDQLFDANGKMLADAKMRPGYAGDMDWYKDIETMGHRQDYTISGRAGGPKTSLYYSIGYLDEKGYITMTDYKRFTGRINADIQAKSWLKYGFNLSGSHQITNNISGGTGNASSFVNPFYFSRHMAPIYPVHLHDMATGEYVLDEQGNRQFDPGDVTRNQNRGRHAIWENQLDRDRTFRNTLNGQAYLDVKFLKDFTFTFRGDMNVRSSDNHVYDNAVIGDGSGLGRAFRENYRYKTYTVQQLLNWNKSFGLHNIDALAAHEYFYDNFNRLNGAKTGEVFANATELVNFTNITDLTDYQDNYRSEGYLSRVRYNYDEKYFLEGSFRRDASSRFHESTRWGNFWSLGGSWLLSQEDFFAPVKHIVDYAKVRVSYGEVGNDASAGRYAYMGLFALDQNANLGAAYKSQNEALDILWETSGAFSAAIETRLFNRANLVVEYFDKRSKNLLFDVNLPLSAGATSSSVAESVVTKNLGSVSNRGLELSFDVDVIQAKDWTWNVGANATWMKNKIVSLPEQNKENGIINGNYKFLEGHGIYDFWTFQYAGVDQTNGRALYLADDENFDPNDQNGAHQDYLVNINGVNYTMLNTYAKRDWSGSAIPKLFGAFNTSLSYKNLTLTGIFTYARGNKVYDDSYLDLMSMSGSVSGLHKDLLKAWDGAPKDMTPTSPDRIDPNGIPLVNFELNSQSNGMSTRFLQDGSYFVIKNIALSYRVPSSLLKAIDLNSASITASVENLATFTKLQGMNPQQSFNGRSLNAFVTPRVMSIAVNIGL